MAAGLRKRLTWSGAWRSLVAHLFWVQGVVSSNLAAPTIFSTKFDIRRDLALMNGASAKQGRFPLGCGIFVDLLADHMGPQFRLTNVMDYVNSGG